MICLLFVLLQVFFLPSADVNAAAPGTSNSALGVGLPPGIPMPPGSMPQPPPQPAPQPRPRPLPSAPRNNVGQSGTGPVDVGNPSVSVCSGFGWTIYSGNCYKIVMGKMDFDTASRACAADDPTAKLASIEDEQENRFVGRLVGEGISASLRTYPMPSPLYNTFWIGLRRVQIGGNLYQSSWIDGKPVTFGNEPNEFTASSPQKYPWGQGQPSGTNVWSYAAPGKEECGHMFSADGQWNDNQCSSEITGGVCKKPAKF